MRENLRVAESMAVGWEWQAAGRLGLAGGKLVFPRVPGGAGIYRFMVTNAAGELTGVYLGEADLLPRRFQHYRTPGSGEGAQRAQTNLRLNPILVEALAAGGGVTVELATRAHMVGSDGTVSDLDLSWKAARVLVERR